MLNSILVSALVELDDWLHSQSRQIRLDIIGGVALHLHEIEILRASMDIDVASDITDKDVLHKIREIGRFHGLDETWIESPGFPIPPHSIFVSHPMFDQFQSIQVKFLSLHHLVLTKIAAYYDRKHLQTIDAADIEAIVNAGGVFNEQVLQEGIQFIRQTRRVNEARLKEVIEDLRLLY